MYLNATARLDKKTKKLVKRLHEGDVAVIDHVDLDRVTAESLVECRPSVVINASRFISGKYPNVGPKLLSEAGIQLVDDVGPEIFDRLREGDSVLVDGDVIYRGSRLIARGKTLTAELLEEEMELAEARLGHELEKFAINTLEYLRREKDILLSGTGIPHIGVDFTGRHALVVVRGYDYKADLRALRSYVREVRPVLIGVDGGADALLAEGYVPDVIIGDMDSVTDEALLTGANIVVHGYASGEAPGLARMQKLGVKASILTAPGTSEDIALLLAHEKGADLIVAVGTHANLIEFLDKGRQGMASTFLVRLKVGEKLVDAKGVNKLYRAKVKMGHLVVLVLAGLSGVAVVTLTSPPVRQLLRLLVLRVRLYVGF